MLAPWLDRELARGFAPTLSEAHAARAKQLAGKRTRHAAARSLDRLIDGAENPRRAFSNPVVPSCSEIREAMPLILSIRTRLHSDQPLNPQAIALLKTLLSDHNGPCYKTEAPGALAAALQRVLEAL